MTQEQIDNERIRRGGPTAAAALIDGVQRGYLLREEAMRRALRHLMIGSHSRRFGELPRVSILGDDAPLHGERHP